MTARTLLWVLDQTHTAMGSRLIRQWIEKPLYNPLHITRRQQAVSALCDDVINRTALTDALRKVFDMERLIGRIVYGTANCRDLRALASAISCLPEIHAHASAFEQSLLRELTGNIDLRDVAWILNGTGSEFNVTWDGANNRILLSPNAPYVKVGGEMSDTVAAVKKLSPSTAAVAVGNKTVQLTGYNVNDNNYYKLRDIGDALGFAVDWDPEGVVVIRSADKTTDDSKNDTSDGNNGGNSSSDQNNSNNNTGNDGQTAETAASWTFSGAGWGHSVGMSQWGAYAMAKQGFSYEDILKFYFTGIEISK